MRKIQPCNTVYKLIGPALVKQDLEEAKQTVEKRRLKQVEIHTLPDQVSELPDN
jgi:chaperonin cofactor prefoldin